VTRSPNDLAEISNAAYAGSYEIETCEECQPALPEHVANNVRAALIALNDRGRLSKTMNEFALAKATEVAAAITRGVMEDGHVVGHRHHVRQRLADAVVAALANRY
jgi:hypothetical protein